MYFILPDSPEWGVQGRIDKLSEIIRMSLRSRVEETMKRSVMAWLLTAILLIALTGYAGAETQDRSEPGRIASLDDLAAARIGV